jgi:hypothetical protein
LSTLRAYRLDMRKVTRWSSSSAGHIMMGATLESRPPIAGQIVNGESLRRTRMRAGLSISELGENYRRGVSRQRVSRIERQAVVSEETVAAYRAAIKLAKARKSAAKQLVTQATAHLKRDFENLKMSHGR